MLWSSHSTKLTDTKTQPDPPSRSLIFLHYLQYLPASLTGERIAGCRLSFPPISRVMDYLTKRPQLMMLPKCVGNEHHCGTPRNQTIPRPDEPPTETIDSSIVGCVHYGDDSEYRRLVETHLQLNKRTGFQFVRRPVKPVPTKGRECGDGTELQTHGGLPEQNTRQDRQHWTASF